MRMQQQNNNNNNKNGRVENRMRDSAKNTENIQQHLFILQYIEFGIIK